MLLDTNSTVVSSLERGFFLRIRTCCKNAKGVSPPKLHAMYLRKPWRVLAIWFCSHLKCGHLITPRRHPFATIGKVTLYVQYCISTHWVDTASKKENYSSNSVLRPATRPHISPLFDRSRFNDIFGGIFRINYNY